MFHIAYPWAWDPYRIGENSRHAFSISRPGNERSAYFVSSISTESAKVLDDAALGKSLATIGE